MSESLLVIYCAPTLAGIKTGNLFSCSCIGSRQAEAVVRQWNRTLNPKGVYAVIMRCRAGRALIYVYRRKRLESDFRTPEIQRLLRRFGYGGRTLDEMLELLAERIQEHGDFPHEIGLFLGYPTGDVKGFIRNGGRNCKCVGQWKVYDDERNARRLFCKYKKCTDVYCRKHEEGTQLSRLTVGL